MKIERKLLYMLHKDIWTLCVWNFFLYVEAPTIKSNSFHENAKDARPLATFFIARLLRNSAQKKPRAAAAFARDCIRSQLIRL